MPEPLLNIEHLDAYYGKSHILQDVNLQVHPGELGKVSFYAKNLTDRTMIGQAVPSLAPNEASRYFSKTECFCFTQQELEARETRDMPLRFIVDAGISENIEQITLSYTFFSLDKGET